MKRSTPETVPVKTFRTSDTKRMGVQCKGVKDLIGERGSSRARTTACSEVCRGFRESAGGLGGGGDRQTMAMQSLSHRSKPPSRRLVKIGSINAALSEAILNELTSLEVRYGS